MPKKMENTSADGSEAKDFAGKNKMERDKGLAPKFGYQSEPGDGENINIPNDAMGEPVSIFAARNNLEGKGEANYPGKFKPVIGRDNLLKDEVGFEKEGNKPGVD